MTSGCVYAGIALNMFAASVIGAAVGTQSAYLAFISGTALEIINGGTILAVCSLMPIAPAIIVGVVVVSFIDMIGYDAL